MARQNAGEPIAYLKSSKREVQRKPGARLLWQMIDPGTPLFPGDSVKTPETGEGEVELVTGKMVLKLEPDSLIVLEASADGRAELNLMSGSLFVKQQQSGTGGTSKAAKDMGPTIKAGNSQLVLGDKSAELSLSISDKQEANIAVAKGEVAVKSGTKTVALAEGQAGKLTDKGVDTSDILEVLSPAPQFISNEDEQPIAITWKPLKKDLQLWLETGTARTQLKRVGQAVTGDVGKMTTAFVRGTTYWRLVAESADKKSHLESVVRRIDVMRYVAPELFAPTNNVDIFLRPDEAIVNFSWQKLEGVTSTLLEVDDNPEMKTPIIKEKLETNDFQYTFKKAGTYHWRVSVTYGEKTAPKVSKGTFDIKKALITQPPKLIAPAPQAEVMSESNKPGEVLLSWEEVGAAESYVVEFATIVNGKKTTRELKTTATIGRMKELADGAYGWRVLAVNEEGKRSPWSEERQFTLINQQALKWETPATDEVQFDSATPTLALSWENSPSVRSWRIRFAGDGKDMAAARWLPVQRPQAKLEFKKEGTYTFEVQGLGDKDAVVAALPKRTIKLVPIPELAAPKLLGYTDKITAQNNGDANFSWAAVGGAKEYQVVLMNKKEKVKEFTTDKTTGGWAGLLPGTYTLRLRSVNKRGVAGPESEAYILEVPNTSNVGAPKSIKVKVK